MTPRDWTADRLPGVHRRLLRAYLTIPAVRARRVERATRAWGNSRRTLFVCAGNICRSPFAERYAGGQESNGRTVASAGCHPIEGRRSPAPAVTAADRWGVELAEHRSRVLTEEMASSAEAIFVFDERDYRRVRRAHPSARGRVHLLATIEREGTPFIADPYGRPVEVFEQTYARIAGIIERNPPCR